MRNLVIIDDEPALRLILKEYFKTTFNVFVLENGNALLEFLENNPLPSAIVIDLLMPDMSGLEVIRKIKSHDKYEALAIIVLSGKTESKERIDCLNEGADDFMIKPFNPEELRARINAILRRINRDI